MKDSKTATEPEKQTDAEVRRDARDEGLEVVRVAYSDPRAPIHYAVFRRRDGARFSKAFTTESAAWEAVPGILAEIAFRREEAAREEQERAERYRAAASEQRLNAAKLPPELQRISLEDFPASRAVDVAKKYVAEFEDKLRTGKGLVFVAGGGLEKVKLAASILEAICAAGYTGRFMTVFDVELAQACGISAIGNPDLLVLACYEAGATIRAVLRARGNKPTVLVASCSVDRLRDLVLFDVSDENAALGLNGWEEMERRAEIVAFPRGAK